MSADERTFWRDMALSQRHRLWGHDCPMTDIDFLACEYDLGQPVGLIEYKHAAAQKQDPFHRSIIALRKLGYAANIPFFGVRYAGDFSWWQATPQNEYARDLLRTRGPRMLSEFEWVRLLYILRGRELPPQIRESLIR